ncbi:MAG: DHA2 family efflux MFS transporter permease subunit [Corynebacterium sp.]|nr:DHA2 family efflux MFS transporter permease subunit [Corynebacterium sp.]
MTDTEPTPNAAQTTRILSILVVSATVMFLNETILSVALASIMETFAVTPAVVQWLTTAFMLTMAIIIPTTGYGLTRFTTRQVFLTATLLFVVGTALGALAPSFAVLVVARIIQACGTAMIMPLLMTTAMELVPPDKRGQVMGIIAIVISVAPALGPTLGGFILAQLSWHYLFWLMLPIIILAMLLGLKELRNVGQPRRVPLDIVSVVLSAAAFGFLIYGLSSFAASLQSGSLTVSIVAIVVGFIALVVFVVWQIGLTARDRALLDMRPFRERSFTLSILTIVCIMAVLLGTVTLIPIYLQTTVGVSALVTGLTLMPGGLIQGLAAPFIGRIFDRVGPRPLLIPGAVLLVTAAVSFTFLRIDSPVWVIAVQWIVFSVALALMMTPLTTTALASVPKRFYGHGSAIMSTLQQLAGAGGTAILITTMTIASDARLAAGVGQAEASAFGTEVAFIVGAIIAAAALVSSLFVRRAEN